MYSIPNPKDLNQSGTKVYKVSAGVCLSQFPSPSSHAHSGLSSAHSGHNSAHTPGPSQSDSTSDIIQQEAPSVHCLCLDWSWKDECAIIAAGFSNGLYTTYNNRILITIFKQL